MSVWIWLRGEREELDLVNPVSLGFATGSVCGSSTDTLVSVLYTYQVQHSTLVSVPHPEQWSSNPVPSSLHIIIDPDTDNRVSSSSVTLSLCT